jgi:hypothetical protein
MLLVIYLTWQINDLHGDGSVVYRRLAGEAAFSVLARVPGMANTYTDTSAPSDGRVCYAFSRYKLPASESRLTEPVCADTLPTPPSQLDTRQP